MEEKLQEYFLQQIEDVLNVYKSESEEKIRTNKDISEAQKIITLSRALIERVSGTSSPYYKQTKEILSKTKIHPAKIAPQLIGVVKSIKHDLEANYLQMFEEEIHNEVFGDFLGMAKHLLDQHFKDAAAVIAGSSLESHLRQLCKKYEIDSFNVNEKERKIPKKASQMNEELSKVYGKTDQKGIIFWLDIRNYAAHGYYDKYTEDQVKSMIIGILDFIRRYPA